MFSRFLHKKHHNLEVIGYFLSCFNPPHQNAPFGFNISCSQTKSSETYRMFL